MKRVPVCAMIVSLICPVAARAAGAADAGAGAAVPAGASPEAAPPPAATGSSESGAPPGDEAGGGLFEQSAAAAAGSNGKSGQGESAGPSAGPAAGASAPFTLSGYVRGDMFGGKVNGANASELKSGYGELDLTLRTAKEPYGDGFAETRVRYGLQGDRTQGTVVELREAYVNTYIGPIDLRLGQQIIVWGRADALNPTNNLTPVDFRIRSPIEDDIRLGNAGARGFLRFAPFRLEGVWMPIYLPTQLPAVTLPQYVTYGPPTFPSLDLKNATEAARLHFEISAFEMSVSYVHGSALLPGLTLPQDGLTLTAGPNGVPSTTTPPSVRVSRTSYEQQVLGFDFSTSLGEVATLRGEVAYRRPYDPPAPGDTDGDHHVAYPDLQYVVGADHNFGSLSLIVQYMGRYVFDWEKQNGPAMQLDPAVLPMQQMSTDEANVRSIVNSTLARTNQILFSQTAQVQHLGTVRFEWLGAHDTLSISSLCLYNFTTREWLVTPRIGYHFSDAVMAYVGAQVFHGPTGTLFGLIDAELSSGYAELRYSF